VLLVFELQYLHKQIMNYSIIECFVCHQYDPCDSTGARSSMCKMLKTSYNLGRKE